MTKEYLEAREDLLSNWGEKFVAEVEKHEQLNMDFSEFLNHCTACGGNWGGMLLTGIKELRPEIWNAIPEEMGKGAFTRICNLLTVIGVEN